MSNFVNIEKLQEAFTSFSGALPFDHCTIDDFLKGDVLKDVLAEFKSYDDKDWYVYENAIENKKALNNWNLFPPKTYSLFSYLNSDSFVSILSNLCGIELHADPGLHGGGWHIHGKGGNLNPHLDYSIHPKLGLQRKLNLIIYVSPTFEESFGGHLGLWRNIEGESPAGIPAKEVFPAQNRAIIFDTTQNSWHGMSRKMNVPDGVFRRSLAIYYLCSPDVSAPGRNRALYAPREDQASNIEVRELIKMRSDLVLSSKVYKTS